MSAAVALLPGEPEATSPNLRVTRMYLPRACRPFTRAPKGAAIQVDHKAVFAGPANGNSISLTVGAYRCNNLGPATPPSIPAQARGASRSKWCQWTSYVVSTDLYLAAVVPKPCRLPEPWSVLAAARVDGRNTDQSDRRPSYLNSCNAQGSNDASGHGHSSFVPASSGWNEKNGR